MARALVSKPNTLIPAALNALRYTSTTFEGTTATLTDTGAVGC